MAIIKMKYFSFLCQMLKTAGGCITIIQNVDNVSCAICFTNTCFLTSCGFIKERCYLFSDNRFQNQTHNLKFVDDKKAICNLSWDLNIIQTLSVATNYPEHPIIMTFAQASTQIFFIKCKNLLHVFKHIQALSVLLPHVYQHVS